MGRIQIAFTRINVCSHECSSGGFPEFCFWSANSLFRAMAMQSGEGFGNVFDQLDAEIPASRVELNNDRIGKAR